MVWSFTMSGGGFGISGPTPAWAGYLGKIQDKDKCVSGEICPWCKAKGQTVTLRTYAINHEETIRLCPSPMCIFPLVSRPLEAVLSSLSSTAPSGHDQQHPSLTHSAPDSPELPKLSTSAPDSPEFIEPPAPVPDTPKPLGHPAPVKDTPKLIEPPVLPQDTPKLIEPPASVPDTPSPPNDQSSALDSPELFQPPSAKRARTEDPLVQSWSLAPDSSTFPDAREQVGVVIQTPEAVVLHEGQVSASSKDEGASVEADSSDMVCTAQQEMEMMTVGGDSIGEDYLPKVSSSEMMTVGGDSMVEDVPAESPPHEEPAAEACTAPAGKGAGANTTAGSDSDSGVQKSSSSNRSWLDALLLALAQSRSLRRLSSGRHDKRTRGRKRKNPNQDASPVLELCASYDSASASHQTHTVSDGGQDAEKRLSNLRSSTLTLLERPLQQKRELTCRPVEVPALVLPVLLDLDSRAREHFQHSVQWESQCQMCGCSSSSSCSNTATAYTYLVSNWHPLSPPVQITCSRCQNVNQMKILHERIPPVFAVHFADGFPTSDVTACSFAYNDTQYAPTTVIQHKAREDLYVSWCRKCDGSWTAYEDFADLRGISHPKLDIPSKEVHMVFWEAEVKARCKASTQKTPKDIPPPPDSQSENVAEETITLHDQSLSTPHEDTFVAALKPNDPNSTSLMDTSISNATLLDTFEGLSHNDIVTLALEPSREPVQEKRPNRKSPMVSLAVGDTAEPSVPEEAQVTTVSSPPVIRRSRRIASKQIEHKDKSTSRQNSFEQDESSESQSEAQPLDSFSDKNSLSNSTVFFPAGPVAGDGSAEPGTPLYIPVDGKLSKSLTVQIHKLPDTTISTLTSDNPKPLPETTLSTVASKNPKPLPNSTLSTLTSENPKALPNSTLSTLTSENPKALPDMTLSTLPLENPKPLPDSTHPTPLENSSPLQTQATQNQLPDTPVKQEPTKPASAKKNYVVRTPIKKKTKGQMLVLQSPKVTDQKSQPAETTESPSQPMETSESPSQAMETTESPSQAMETTESPSQPVKNTESPSQPMKTTEPQSEPMETLVQNSPESPSVTNPSPLRPAVKSSDQVLQMLAYPTFMVNLPLQSSLSAATQNQPVKALATQRVTTTMPNLATQEPIVQVPATQNLPVNISDRRSSTKGSEASQQTQQILPTILASSDTSPTQPQTLDNLPPDTIITLNLDIEMDTSGSEQLQPPEIILPSSTLDTPHMQGPNRPGSDYQNLELMSPFEQNVEDPTPVGQNTPQLIGAVMQTPAQLRGTAIQNLPQTKGNAPQKPSQQTAPVMSPTLVTLQQPVIHTPTMQTVQVLDTLNLTPVKRNPSPPQTSPTQALPILNTQNLTPVKQNPSPPKTSPTETLVILNTKNLTPVKQNPSPPKTSPSTPQSITPLNLTSPSTPHSITPLDLDAESDFPQPDDLPNELPEELDLILPSVVPSHPQHQHHAIPVSMETAPVMSPVTPAPALPLPSSSSVSPTACLSPKHRKASPPKQQPQQSTNTSTVTVVPPTVKLVNTKTVAPPVVKVKVEQTRSAEPPKATPKPNLSKVPPVKPHLFSGFKTQQTKGTSSTSAGSSSVSVSVDVPTSGLLGLATKQFLSKPSLPKTTPTGVQLPPLLKTPPVIKTLLSGIPKPVKSAGAKPDLSIVNLGPAATSALLKSKKELSQALAVPASASAAPEDVKTASLRLKLLKKLKSKKKQLAELDQMLRQRGMVPQTTQSAPPSVAPPSSLSTATSPGSAASSQMTSPGTPSAASTISSSDGTEMLDMLVSGGEDALGELMNSQHPQLSYPSNAPPHHDATSTPAPPAEDFLTIDDFLDDVIFDTSRTEKAMENSEFDELDMFL